MVDFKLKQESFTLDITKKFFIMRVVEHWHRLPKGCPIPGNIPGQGGRGSGQLVLIEGVHAHCSECWTRWPLKILPSRSILQFYVLLKNSVMAGIPSLL